MKKQFLLFLYVLVSMLFSSCTKNMFDCFIATGSKTTEERQTGDFNSFRMENNIDVITIHDSVCHVKVECGSGIIDNIHTEVNDGRLRIWNTNKCNWARDMEAKITVYVYYKDLEVIEYASIGDLTTQDTLKAKKFAINVRDGAGTIDLKVNIDTAFFSDHYGSADIILSGKVKAQYIFKNGVGPVNALGITSSFTYVNNQSTNDCFVNVTDHLEARIDYYGNIYYLGDPPEIVTWINGKGKLLKYLK